MSDRQPCYLGLDLGTSGVKATLIDADQRVMGSCSAALEVQRPQSGWSEQNPADWLAAAQQAMDDLARTHDLGGLRGIGLSGQMHGAVCLDRNDQVLRPAILWNDSRAQIEAAELDADPLFRAQSGNIVFPGFTAPKLVWMARHEPALFNRVDCVLLPKDYLRLWLTGERLSEMSDASGTSWLDVGRRDWSGALLAASGLTRGQMPGLVEGTAVAGRLRPALAQRWGIAGQPVVAGGAGDNAATAMGAGTVAAGQGFVSLGTSGVLFVATDRFLPAPATAVHAFCHALPDRWHQMGVILSAASSLGWLAQIVGAAPATLTQGLGPLTAPGEVMFLPYLAGERTPHNDARARGVFAGLGAGSDRTALVKAVLEGVALALADNLDALQAAGSRLDAVLALGGGARSDYWLSVLATALDLPVLRPVGGDYGAAFGAARLGLIAAEDAEPAAICTPPAIERDFAPDPALRDAFAAAHQRFRALFPASHG